MEPPVKCWMLPPPDVVTVAIALVAAPSAPLAPPW